MSEEKTEKKVSRRSFLRSTGLTVGGITVGTALGAVILPKEKEIVKEVESHTPTYTEAMQFFTRKEDFDCLAAATECIYPEDEHGPGAIGLGVPYYIDKQLATAWGKNGEEYRSFPFQEGETALNRGQIFIKGLRKLNEISRKNHDTTFQSLEQQNQIEILKQFEAGEVPMELVSSAEFFAPIKTSHIRRLLL